MKKSVLSVAVVAAVLAAAAPARAALDDDTRRSAAQKLAGKKHYVEFCASCHGDQGAGNGPRSPGKMPDFTTPQAVVTFDAERMAAGVAGRHDATTRATWEKALSAEDTAAVVAYMREAFMLPAPTADASRGRAIYAKTCSVCHGDRGNGASWAKNSLNPSPADFTSEKVKELSRRHMINTVTYGSPKTAMMGFSIQLSREEIAAVVDYVRSTFMFPGSVPEDGNAGRENLGYGNRMLSSTGGHHGGGGDAAAAGGKHAQHGGHSGPADMTAPLPNGLVGDAAAGKKFFDNNCYVCHGKEGKGDGPRAYFITPKPANLTSPESRESLNRPHLFTSISKGSLGSEMPAWSKVLSDQEIANVAEYVFNAFIQPAGAPANPAPAQPAGAVDQKKN